MQIFNVPKKASLSCEVKTLLLMRHNTFCTNFLLYWKDVWLNECSRQPLLQTIVRKTKGENHAQSWLVGFLSFNRHWNFMMEIIVWRSDSHISLHILVRTLLESLMRRVYDARKTFAFYSLPNYHQKKFIDKIFKVLSVPLLDVVFA